MTEDGEVTVLPGHEPLLSAIRPGILSIEYKGDKDEVKSATYATSG
jgi:F0F1-type ATP synthase epsilon subunit